MEPSQLFIDVVFPSVLGTVGDQKNPDFYNMADSNSVSEGNMDDIDQGQDAKIVGSLGLASAKATRPLEQYYSGLVDPIEGDAFEPLLELNSRDEGDNKKLLLLGLFLDS
jgi:hypothetical protein